MPGAGQQQRGEQACGAASHNGDIQRVPLPASLGSLSRPGTRRIAAGQRGTYRGHEQRPLRFADGRRAAGR